MAEGIRKRHSKGCRARGGGRCNCKAGWEAWVFSKRDGKKVRKTFRHRAEAKSWRGEALAALSRGRPASALSERRPLYDVMVEFVAGMKTGEVRPRGRTRYKPNTVRSYERAVRLRLCDSELGALRPAEVRRSDIQAFADELLALMSPGSASNVLNPLQAYYRRAVRREELAFNPTEEIDMPEKGSKRARRVVSPGGAAALLAVVPPEDRPIWATAFYAGLRRGELQALRCVDVDLDANLIHVREGWDQVEGEIEPKSKAAKRAIPILAVLRDHLADPMERTGRTGKDRIFGRSAREVLRLHRRWPRQARLAGAQRHRARGGGGAGEGTRVTNPADHARVPPHLRLHLDRHRGEPESDSRGHGPLEDPDDLRRLRAPPPRQL